MEFARTFTGVIKHINCCCLNDQNVAFGTHLLSRQTSLEQASALMRFCVSNPTSGSLYLSNANCHSALSPFLMAPQYTALRISGSMLQHGRCERLATGIVVSDLLTQTAYVKTIEDAVMY